MKKIIILGMVSIFLLTSFNGNINAGEQNNSDTIVKTYSFGLPVVSEVNIESNEYYSVSIDGVSCDGNPGEPLLPGKGAYILLPPNSQVSNIIVNPGEMVSLGSGYLVEPASRAVSLSNTEDIKVPVPNLEIYSSTDLFPGSLFTKIGTYNCKGYTILVLRLNPVQYIPASGELFYYTDLTVNVETVEETKDNSLFRELQVDNIDVISKVDNPSIGGRYMEMAQSQPASPFRYDLLIITSDALKSSFEPLKEAHENEGLSTLIYTVEDIYNNYSGVDNAEKIRNYIKHAYYFYGIEYVLLGGDTDIVPSRGFWDSELSNGWYFNDIPSDFYYSDLNGIWNKPENPNPNDLDLSLSDQGVTGSGGGVLGNPILDFTDFVVGYSSISSTVVNDDQSNEGYINLSFGTPMDLSSVNWLSFYTKSVSQADIYGFDVYLCDIHSNRIYAGYADLSHKWFYKELEISHPYSEDFDMTSVVSISFKSRCLPHYNHVIGDVLKIDGIYFTYFKDDRWGEPNEGDLFAEVFVGRACVDDTNDVNNFITKTLAYMNCEDESYLKKVLFAGELLFIIPPPAQYGNTYLDELIGECNHNGYTTQGFPLLKFLIEKLYDRHEIIFHWTKNELIRKINNNIHVINHVGHGNNFLLMRLDCVQDIYNLSNDKYFFVYSQACFSGAFDNKDFYGSTLPYDCIGEYLTAKTDHGAFSAILNSRLGWGSIDYNASSQHFHREFWDAVFGENITIISKANQDSKEDNIWRIDYQFNRWVFYELNLFGDPTVQFKYLDSSLTNLQSSSSSSTISSSSSISSIQSSSTVAQATMGSTIISGKTTSG